MSRPLARMATCRREIFGPGLSGFMNFVVPALSACPLEQQLASLAATTGRRVLTFLIGVATARVTRGARN